MVEGLFRLRGPWIIYLVRFLCQCIPSFSFGFFFCFLLLADDGLFSFQRYQSLASALYILFGLFHSWHSTWTIRDFLSKGVSLPVCSLHSHRPTRYVIDPLFVIHPVSPFTEVLFSPVLVSVVVPDIALLMIVVILFSFLLLGFSYYALILSIMAWPYW